MALTIEYNKNTAYLFTDYFILYIMSIIYIIYTYNEYIIYKYITLYSSVWLWKKRTQRE